MYLNLGPKYYIYPRIIAKQAANLYNAGYLHTNIYIFSSYTHLSFQFRKQYNPASKRNELCLKVVGLTTDNIFY